MASPRMPRSPLSVSRAYLTSLSLEATLAATDMTVKAPHFRHRGNETGSSSPARRDQPLSLKPTDELIDLCFELSVIFNLPLDLLIAVEDGGVVFATELFADIGKRVLGQLPGEVHRHLARHGYLFAAFARTQQMHRHLKVGRDHLLNAIDGDRRFAAIQHI